MKLLAFIFEQPSYCIKFLENPIGLKRVNCNIEKQCRRECYVADMVSYQELHFLLWQKTRTWKETQFGLNIEKRWQNVEPDLCSSYLTL